MGTRSKKHSSLCLPEELPIQRTWALNTMRSSWVYTGVSGTCTTNCQSVILHSNYLLDPYLTRWWFLKRRYPLSPIPLAGCLLRIGQNVFVRCLSQLFAFPHCFKVFFVMKVLCHVPVCPPSRFPFWRRSSATCNTVCFHRKWKVFVIFCLYVSSSPRMIQRSQSNCFDDTTLSYISTFVDA